MISFIGENEGLIKGEKKGQSDTFNILRDMGLLSEQQIAEAKARLEALKTEQK